MDGDELRRRREALGLNQTELAARLGLPRNTVWRWESGKYRITWPVLLSLAMHGLECDADVERARAEMRREVPWLSVEPAELLKGTGDG